MSLFSRDFILCHAKSFESHLYNDPVMLICSHVFCRSCCLYLAERSIDKSIICPICSIRIPFDNINRFINNLIKHETLANLVKKYLQKEKEENNYCLCYSCKINYINNGDKLCEKCLIENENIKKQIIETMNYCEELFINQKKLLSKEKVNYLYTKIDQQTTDLMTNIDKYQEELDNLLNIQEQTNEINASKHQPIDIKIVSTLVEPRLHALRNNENFLQNINVEKEIKRLNDEADRQIRLLKHRSDTVPILSPPTKTLPENIFGELKFESKTSMINTSGDTSLQSIPLKLPMWTVSIKGLPDYLSIYPIGKSILIFSCSLTGIISLLTYISPVTYDSPRYIRTFNLFPNQKHIYVQSFTVFNRFMLLHIRSKTDNDLLYFFTHDGILEHEPIELLNPIQQYLADENRIWAIDSITQTIFFHIQPLYTHEINSNISKREQFISFNNNDQTNFIPFRLGINQQLIAILSQDLQQVFIYNKNTCEQIFLSHFSIGNSMNIWDIGLFPRDNSLLLKFDLTSDGNVRRSLFIHFNTKNQSVGRIEGKHCLGVVIGPNKEILIGYNLRTGIIRCYM